VEVEGGAVPVPHVELEVVVLLA
jgi:hypothetical protein